MREHEIASVDRRRHCCSALALLLLLAFSTGAGAEATTLQLPASAREPSTSSQVSTLSGDLPAATSQPASGPAADTSVPRAACLQEGEACNPLNDLCCPGYYCPGGLARTCAPKP
jgi:hypothetical protein